MAYSPSEKYPGAVDVDPDYQGGKFRDNNPSTTNNGSPLKAIDRNELLARDEAIMNDAGFEYNGLPDTPQDSQLFKAYKASLGNGANLLSNHNFLIQTPDDSQLLPSATPTSYPPGYQIFSGVFANETTGITNLTYIDGRVSFSGGDLYFAVPNTGGVERLTEFAASVADFDGKPRTRGVSFALVGDEYRVTVTTDALEDVSANPTPLGSVKFEQGSVATRHFVGANAQEQSHTGDNQNSGLKIYPSNSQESASTSAPNNNAPAGTTGLRDAVGGNVYETWKDGELTAVSGVVTEFNVTTAPYTAIVGGVSVYLAAIRYDNESQLDIRAMGATAGDDCMTFIKAAVEAGHTDILVKGDFNNGANNIPLKSDVTTINFDGGTITQLGDIVSIFSNPTQTTLTPTVLPAYYSFSVTVTDAANVARGDSIGFVSSTNSETLYNTPRQWLTTVSHVVGNQIFFSGPCRFNFQTATSVQVLHSKRRILKIKGLKMNTESITQVAKGWRFDDLKVDFEDIEQINSQNSYTLSVIRGYDCTIRNLEAQKGSYASLFTLCWNTRANNVTGHNARHVVSGTGWSDGIWVDGVNGSGALVESHPAFNVHFDNCNVTTGGDGQPDYVNLRSVGGSIRNAKFQHVGTAQSEGPFIQNIPLIDPEPYTDAEFEMENVKWYEQVTSQDQAANLIVDRCGRVNLKNVHAGGDIVFSGATPGQVDKVSLDDVTSQTGVITGRGVSISNSNHKLDADVVSADVYAVKAYGAGQGPFNVQTEGIIYRNNTIGQTYSFNFRIYPNIQFLNPSQRATGTLKFKISSRHSNAGQFAYIEREYNWFSQVIPTESVNFPSTPIFASAQSGQGSESLDISAISAVFVPGATYLDEYIDVSVTVDAGARTNPIIQTIDYELETNNV